MRLFADGEEIIPDRRIGRGGEGEVYSLQNRRGFAVKTYLPKVVRDKEPKIRAMVSAGLTSQATMVAFPQQVVVDARGHFAGFVMRLVENHKEIHELQTPSSRHRHFPNADYRFLVRVALNISRVFAQVHGSGCVVGDINQRGILVSSNATVALIDADSFQVSFAGKQYLCTVGVPEYTPPELQGKSLKSVIRTADHDSFGLAVCLFQVLCMDRHPFAGRLKAPGEMPLERAIAEFRFAYSERDTGTSPPPGSVRLRDFTPKVRRLFEEAFSPLHVGRRPTASAWVEALSELEASLRACSRNRLHHYAKDSPECPWCRMEAQFGQPLFLDTGLGDVTFPTGRVDPNLGLVVDIAALLAMINSVPIPTSVAVSLPVVPQPAAPSQRAADFKASQWNDPARKFLGLCALAAAFGVFVTGAAPIVVALVAAGLGAWLLAWPSEGGESLARDFGIRESAVRSRLDEVQRSAPIEKLLRAKAQALDALDELRALGSSYSGIISEYDRQRRQRQLDKHLSTFPLRGAGISKLTSSDVASLASYGITTALEAKTRDVQEAYGIGRVKAATIAAWVGRVEARFQFQAAYSDEDRRLVRAAQAAVLRRQQEAEGRIRSLIEAFRSEAREFEKWKQIGGKDPELLRRCQELAQSQVDLRFAGLPIPLVNPLPPLSVPPVEKFRQAGQGIVSGGYGGSSRAVGAVYCPVCQSTMVRRVARRGSRAGRAFWGCSRFPSCSGTRPI